MAFLREHTLSLPLLSTCAHTHVHICAHTCVHTHIHKELLRPERGGWGGDSSVLQRLSRMCEALSYIPSTTKQTKTALGTMAASDTEEQVAIELFN